MHRRETSLMHQRERTHDVSTDEVTRCCDHPDIYLRTRSLETYAECTNCDTQFPENVLEIALAVQCKGANVCEYCGDTFAAGKAFLHIDSICVACASCCPLESAPEPLAADESCCDDPDLEEVQKSPTNFARCADMIDKCRNCGATFG